MRRRWVGVVVVGGRRRSRQHSNTAPAPAPPARPARAARVVWRHIRTARRKRAGRQQRRRRRRDERRRGAGPADRCQGRQGQPRPALLLLLLLIDEAGWTEAVRGPAGGAQGRGVGARVSCPDSGPATRAAHMCGAARANNRGRSEAPGRAGQRRRSRPRHGTTRARAPRRSERTSGDRRRGRRDAVRRGGAGRGGREEKRGRTMGSPSRGGGGGGVGGWGRTTRRRAPWRRSGSPGQAPATGRTGARTRHGGLGSVAAVEEEEEGGDGDPEGRGRLCADGTRGAQRADGADGAGGDDPGASPATRSRARARAPGGALLCSVLRCVRSLAGVRRPSAPARGLAPDGTLSRLTRPARANERERGFRGRR